jgi:hypothetical protein
METGIAGSSRIGYEPSENEVQIPPKEEVAPVLSTFDLRLIPISKITTAVSCINGILFRLLQ